MINVAVNCLSRKSRKIYSCPGLGDNIHKANIAYHLFKERGEQVRLHFGVEKNSERRWEEIVSLFPKNSISYKFYHQGRMTDPDWMKWLEQTAGVKNIEMFRYNESPLHLTQHCTINVDELFKTPALLPAKEECANDWQRPEKYITVQWDAQWSKRELAQSKINRIEQHYRDQGYEIVPIGGRSTNKWMKGSLAHIGYALSGASYHVGVNSGMWHMAQLYMPYENISVYTEHNAADDDHVSRILYWGGKHNELS